MEVKRSATINLIQWFAGLILIMGLCVLPSEAQDRFKAEREFVSTDAGVQVDQMTLQEESNSKRSVLEQSISIRTEDASLLDILENVTEQAGLKLSYSRHNIPADIRKSLSLEQATLEEALWMILEGTKLRFAISPNDHLVLFEDIKPSGSEERIQEEVEGVVSDATTGSALPGVNIVVKGTNSGTSTDADGHFELTVPSLNDTLLFSYVGYEQLEMPINGRSDLDVEMQSEAVAGEEVVVVGYGTQDREDVTTSLSHVAGEDLSKRSARNVTSSLQGMSAGVTVQDLGGEPGAANTNIRIRGVTTLGDSNPLFIVDGVEQSYNDIDPNDIESITVLEDAASTAIYGSRAANGVVLIETKRGTSGDIQVSYNGRIDFQNLATVPEHMDTEEYLRLQNLAYENRGSDPLYSEEDIENYVSGENPLEYPPPNDWFEEVIQDNAPMTRNYLSISGGGERISSYGSFSRFNQQGIYPNRDAKRYQFNLNNDIFITDYLTIKADLRVKRNNRFSTNDIGQGLYHNMTHGSQFTVPQYPDGTYDLSPQGHNPLAYADPDIAGGNDHETNSIIGNLEGSWDITDGLTFTSRFAVESVDMAQVQNYPTYEIRDYENPEVVLKNRQINSLDELREESLQLTWYNTINYVVNLNNHNFDLLGGYSQESYDFKSVLASGRDLYNNELRDLSQTETESRTINSSYQDWGLRSLFSRISYDFDQRYLVQFSLRYDGSSRFPEGDRYTFFPSGSIGWNISEESFWEPYRSTVDEFKLRASWGETGNQNVGLYTYFDNLSVMQNAYVFNDNPQVGVAQNDVTSENLSWETTTQSNIGFDLSFLDGQYSATFDVFKKNTEGILLTLPIAGTVGLNPAATNAGSVENRGWELELQHRNTFDDFFYSLSLNLSDVKNEITDLAGTGPYFTAARDWQIRKEGAPIDAIWGYETDGFLTEEDLEKDYPTYASDPYPGDIKYVDRNGDGVINSDDKKVLGSTLPRWEYGANIDLGWRNFDLNMQFQGVGKRDVGLVGAFTEGGSWEGFTIEKAGDYWSPENQDARFPRPQKQTLKNQQPSDWWVVDASYLRLKNIQFSYSLPSNIIERLGMRTAQFFIGGTNLLTFSNLNDWGVDAEAPLGRGDYYPPVKTYTVGLNVNL